MKFLLDEQLHEAAARSLDAVAGLKGDSFSHILNHRPPGTKDEDIPKLCRELGADALVTANVKDFGARKVHIEALMESGVSVLVLRPGKVKLSPENQVGMLAPHLERVRLMLREATSPALIRITPSAQPVRRTLEELLAEFPDS